jgi:hypothetical protein
MMPEPTPKRKRGRPSQGLTNNINVRLFPHQPARIAELAAETGVDASVIIRLALDLGLSDLKDGKIFPLLKSMGR